MGRNHAGPDDYNNSASQSIVVNMKKGEHASIKTSGVGSTCFLMEGLHFLDSSLQESFISLRNKTNNEHFNKYQLLFLYTLKTGHLFKQSSDSCSNKDIQYQFKFFRVFKV